MSTRMPCPVLVSPPQSWTLVHLPADRPQVGTLGILPVKAKPDEVQKLREQQQQQQRRSSRPVVEPSTLQHNKSSSGSPVVQGAETPAVPQTVLALRGREDAQPAAADVAKRQNWCLLT